MSRQRHADETEVQQKNQSEVCELKGKFQGEERFPVSLEYNSFTS